MNFKKILFILITFSLIVLFKPTNTKAEEATTAEVKLQEINIEINDQNADLVIKEQILAQEAKENIFDLKDVNIDKTSIKLSTIDTTKLGSYKTSVLLNLEFNTLNDNLIKHSIQKDVVINVIDTIAPTIEMKYNFYRLDYGEEYKPLDYIEKINDNSLEEITNVWVEGTEQINSDNPGTYYVTYFAHDSSGNLTSKEFKMIVKPKSVPKAVKVASQDGDKITAMLNAINNVRAEHGLYALELGDASALSASATRAAEASSYCSHTRPNGHSYKTAFDDYNVDYSYAVEILTYSGSSIEDKLNWWLNSKVHRKHVLTKVASKISIGYSGKMWQAIVYND